MRTRGSRNTERALRLLFLSACLIATGCKPLVNSFAFHPDTSFSVPADRLPADTEEIFLDTADGVRIQALHLRNPDSAFITLYFHGNAGNLYHRLVDYQRLRQRGTAVFAVSYRGYAKSSGSPSEAGIYYDAEAAFRHVTDTLGYPESRIIVLGRSVGSAAATNLVRDRQVAGLILISPLTSARDMASAMGLGFAAPLTGNAFDNMSKIARLKAPLLVIHGTRDGIIPIGQGRKLFEAVPDRKTFRAIEGAGHNDLSSRFAPQYWAAIETFLRTAAGNR